MPDMTLPVPVPRPNYSQARENLVKAIPPQILCLLTCGGVDCRYEGPACWGANQQAVRGLFSSWVTDDIVAMTRPSNHLIEKYDIIEQFQRLKIKSIINMQLPGEHAHCGPPLDPDSGFTYSPQVFMENDVFFYNFGMPDFGVFSLVAMIDAVKVLAFAVKEGKVAVHCHAGLGRTGVLIACYLIYTLRIGPSEAVHYVRIKRPCSIQTRAQISQVFDFARLLSTQFTQYPDLGLRHGAPFTLQHHLSRQALLLHGQEARTLKHTPKIVFLLCVRLSCLALGLPAPPEVHAELEKSSALRTLGRTVRETLLSKQYLPVLREGHRGSWVGSGSVSSWDEPLGFLERKREVLMDKRSYSDSDLSKITDLEPGSLRIPTLGVQGDWCGQDLIRAVKNPFTPSHSSLSSSLWTSKKDSHTLKILTSTRTITSNCAKMSKFTAKKKTALPKCCSNLEVTLQRNQNGSSHASVMRATARAMANQDPPEETVLQRSALLQEELNSSCSGWALLVTESDPHVLSCLLWTWLEKLKEPILSAADVEKLTAEANHKNSLGVLRRAQRHTVYCLLSCVAAVTSLCPHSEEAVIQRLTRALIRRPLEEMNGHAALIKVLRTGCREALHPFSVPTRACSRACSRTCTRTCTRACTRTCSSSANA
ncbi:protein tyrosine phosphatase domain-containing protein 1 [Lampris incognitus]|uniref:protein tyrosine phosphatase domain-containing protein 1 n=1 Tax=Lampris incognitus TaxID=2546036 RepID=UPI0024B4A1D9|nr:protein tyrosine phosphatase domain-containing protein 1 [Lampris incognitus]